MTFLYFLAALLGIVLLAAAVNRLTGTRASYLETLQLEPSELELWRDAAADFGTLPRLGQAQVTSYPRSHRHSAVWTTHRLVVAQRPLGSAKHMITHQIVFESAHTLASAREATAKFAGGFYGRGFETLLAVSHSFAQVNGRECVRLVLSTESSAVSNLLEVYLFSERLAALRDAQR